MDVNPSDAALFINGMYFDMDFTDIYTLLDHIRTEDRVMGGLYKLGKFALSHLCSLFVCLILKIYIFIHFNQFSFFFCFCFCFVYLQDVYSHHSCLLAFSLIFLFILDFHYALLKIEAKSFEVKEACRKDV